MDAWIAEWNRQIKKVLHRLAEAPATASLAVEMFEEAATGAPPVTGARSIADAFGRRLDEHGDAWERALDAGEAALLAARLGRPIVGRRRGLPPGVPGHIRVVLVGEGGATVRSLVVRTAPGEASAPELAHIYPAVTRANEALLVVQRDLIPESSLLPRDVQELLLDLGAWRGKPEIAGLTFAGLRDLLARSARIASHAPHHVEEAALDLCVQVGDPETGTDSRSIELPFTLAAMSSLFGCAAADGLVVATGCLDVDLNVRPVQNFDRKRKAVLAWARGRHQRVGGQVPSTRVLFLHPAANHEPVEVADEAAWKAHVSAVPVRNLREAWETIQRVRPRLWTWAEPMFAAAIAVWYFERVLVGEYAGDPLTPEKLGWSRALVLSGVAAAVMGGLFIIDVARGPYARTARARRALSLAYLPAAWGVMLLFVATGTLDFPDHTPFMKNHDAVSRRLWVWKDLAIVYPLVVAFFAAFWRVTRADVLATALRRAGLPWAARSALDEANDRIGRAIQRGYPHLASFYVIVNATLIAYDFYWYGQKPDKTVYTWLMIVHILFQVAWGFFWFGLAGLQLRPARRERGAEATTPA